MGKHEATCKGGISIALGYLTGALNAIRTWNDAFQVLKDNNCQSRALCPVKLYVIIEENSYDKNRIKKRMSTKSVLQKILKGILQIKEENKPTHEDTGRNKSCQNDRPSGGGEGGTQ